MRRILFFILCPLIGLAQTIEYDHSLPSAVYAAERLQKALAKASGKAMANSRTRAGGGGNEAANYTIRLIIDSSRLGAESYSILRGAVALQYYRRTGHPNDQQQAIAFLQSALKDWDTVVAITRPIYMDMPLTHLSEQDGIRSKENAQRRWHWAMTRPDVARDIDIARKAVPGK